MDGPPLVAYGAVLLSVRHERVHTGRVCFGRWHKFGFLTQRLDLQEPSRFGNARCGESVLAGRDAGEGGELSPAERRAGRGELFGHGTVILLGVQCPILADGVAEQKVEGWPSSP